MVIMNAINTSGAPRHSLYFIEDFIEFIFGIPVIGELIEATFGLIFSIPIIGRMLRWFYIDVFWDVLDAPRVNGRSGWMWAIIVAFIVFWVSSYIAWSILPSIYKAIVYTFAAIGNAIIQLICRIFHIKIEEKEPEEFVDLPKSKNTYENDEGKALHAALHGNIEFFLHENGYPYPYIIPYDRVILEEGRKGEKLTGLEKAYVFSGYGYDGQPFGHPWGMEERMLKEWIEYTEDKKIWDNEIPGEDCHFYYPNYGQLHDGILKGYGPSDYRMLNREVYKQIKNNEYVLPGINNENKKDNPVVAFPSKK